MLGQQRSQIRIDRSTFFATHEFLSQESKSSLRDGVRGQNADRNLLRPGIRPTFRHELSVLSRAPGLRSNQAVLTMPQFSEIEASARHSRAFLVRKASPPRRAKRREVHLTCFFLVSMDEKPQSSRRQNTSKTDTRDDEKADDRRQKSSYSLELRKEIGANDECLRLLIRHPHNRR